MFSIFEPPHPRAAGSSERERLRKMETLGEHGPRLPSPDRNLPSSNQSSPTKLFAHTKRMKIPLCTSAKEGTRRVVAAAAAARPAKMFRIIKEKRAMDTGS